MSIEAITLVWKHSKAKLGARLVLLAIADFADESLTAWPAVETLAAKSLMSERNCRTCLRSLEKSKEIRTDKNAGKNGCNRYVITIAKSSGGNSSQGAEYNIPRGEKPHPSPDRIAPNPSEGNRQKGTVKKQRALRAADPRCDEFRKLWESSYKAKFGRDYIFTAKNEQRTRELFRATTMTPSELADAAWRAWQCGGPNFWNCERAGDIDFFASNVNKIMAELDAGVRRPAAKAGDDDHEARYGVPRGKLALSSRPPPGEDERGKQIGVDEWNRRFPLTDYDHDK